jgi:hypothetical protein
LGLPDEDDFDYDEFIDEEFGDGKKRAARTSIHVGWRWVAAVMLALIMIWMLGR